MEIAKIRREINQYLEQADDRLLTLIHGLIKADQKSASAENSQNTTPNTKADLFKRSEKDNKEGTVKTIKQLSDEIVVGYTGDGEPLTKESYNKRLEEAERQILAGEYISQEDLEKESENW